MCAKWSTGNPGRVETLADVPKQEEHKLNLRLTGFKAKEGETEKELV